MLVQENQGATVFNRINKIFPDHFIWINSQLKSRKYMATRGREVLIKTPGSTSVNMVNIPGKSEPSYFDAWAKVYNYALDYLEGALNRACLENRFIRRAGNNWTLNGHVIVWPKFSPLDASYAKGLDAILDEYNLVKAKYIKSVQKEDTGISVKKSSVSLKPANEVTLSNNEVTLPNKNTYASATVKPVDSTPKIKLVQKPTPIVKEDNLKKNENASLVIQKVSDGDLLNNRDISKLRDDNTDIVVLTCQDALAPKEEDIFLSNMGTCQNEGFKTGAFIYGKATDEHTGAIELKRILKMLYNCGNNFSGLVIYSISNDYVLKNKNSDIKLLDFINMYNSVASTLKQSGYDVMISMNLKSGKIIEDINRRYNMQNEHEAIYMVVVRDVSEVNENASSIVVDPGNDYDVVTINNEGLCSSLKEKVSNEGGLAKVA